MEELVKCEECPFYDQCKALGEHYLCPMAKNFDNAIMEIIDAKDIEDLRDRVHNVVKNIIKRYEKPDAKESP